MRIALHPVRAQGFRVMASLPDGTTTFWTWQQIEDALRATNGIREDEKLAALVVEDRGITLCLERR